MAKVAIVAIVLAAGTVSLTRAMGRTDSWGESYQRGQRPPDATLLGVRDVLHRISNGKADAGDDELLVKLVKDEIVRTARKIKANTPAVSVETAAKRTKNLVSELTSAYTAAIYASNTTEDARRNFVRFRSTVRQIVDFTKSGQLARLVAK